MIQFTSHPAVRDLIDLAIREDIEAGDITTESTIRSAHSSRAKLIAKSELVVAGHAVAENVFKRIDHRTRYFAHIKDTVKVEPNHVIATVEGSISSLLIAERVALNFLQRLSGIATQTSLFIEKVKSTPVKILDTRKTTPGWRFLEKYAVRAGGGQNHRFNLGEGILIKDNHILASGGIQQALSLAKSQRRHLQKIEIEVKSWDEAVEAFNGGADVLLLDNMDPHLVKKIASKFGKEIELEASGGITLNNIDEYAMTGVHFISIGALTHSFTSADISMNLE